MSDLQKTTEPLITKLEKRVFKVYEKLESIEEEMLTKVKLIEGKLQNDITDFRAQVEVNLEEKGKYFSPHPV